MTGLPQITFQKKRKGYTKEDINLVDTEDKIDLVLVFDVIVQAPLKFTCQTTEEGSPTKSNSTRTNPYGTSETAEVAIPGESRHYSYDYHTHDKVLILNPADHHCSAPTGVCRTVA